MIRNFAKHILSLLPSPLRNTIKTFQSSRIQKKIIRDWKYSGKPLPPPHRVKEITIDAYRFKSNYDILVETGTYMGDMIESQIKKFKEIYSIELSEKLWAMAVDKFSKYKHIKIIHGDSGKILGNITSQLTRSAIFWLDGHYSGAGTAKSNKECPIMEELDTIMKDKEFKHIILIDDARLFVGKNDYPTIEDLTKYILSKDSKYRISIENDIICCVHENS
ncbi:MAG: hypothetical protein HY840_01325 [Bacteroidetes bacterium]|nr:hypothetical protein [Bacteroidota bacterium]